MVTAYSQKIFSGQKPVFDGRKNLYSREPLPIGRDKVSSRLYMHVIESFIDGFSRWHESDALVMGGGGDIRKECF